MSSDLAVSATTTILASPLADITPVCASNCMYITTTLSMEFIQKAFILVCYSLWLLLPLIRPALEFKLSTKMAARSYSVDGSLGKLDRNDPQYVNFLEDQLERASERYERSEGNIRQIMSRLDRLEITDKHFNYNPFSSSSDVKINFTARKPGQAPTLTPQSLIQYINTYVQCHIQYSSKTIYSTTGDRNYLQSVNNMS